MPTELSTSNVSALKVSARIGSAASAPRSRFFLTLSFLAVRIDTVDRQDELSPNVSGLTFPVRLGRLGERIDLLDDGTQPIDFEEGAKQLQVGPARTDHDVPATALSGLGRDKWDTVSEPEACGPRSRTDRHEPELTSWVLPELRGTLE